MISFLIGILGGLLFNALNLVAIKNKIEDGSLITLYIIYSLIFIISFFIEFFILKSGNILIGNISYIVSSLFFFTLSREEILEMVIKRISWEEEILNKNK
jgi:hypothetical protein